MTVIMYCLDGTKVNVPPESDLFAEVARWLSQWGRGVEQTISCTWGAIHVRIEG